MTTNQAELLISYKFCGILQEKHSKYALHLILWRVFHWDLIISGFVHGIKEICMIVVMPYSVGQLVSYFGNKSETVSESKAYMFAVTIIVFLLVDRLISHLIFMWLKHMSMKIRVGCCSLVYRKSLRLSLKALHKTNIGQIVNLLSNDASKFDYGLVLFHYAWTGPLQTAIATYMVYNLVGIAAFSGIGFILLLVPLQIYCARKNGIVRLKTALQTDERVRLMNEILSGIQIIKMYTWEKPFAKLISLSRKFEMKWIRIHSYIASFIFSLKTFALRTSIFITIVVYLLLGSNLDASVVYSIIAIYNLIQAAVSTLFAIAVSGISETIITIHRLENFLRNEEAQIMYHRSGKVNNKLELLNSNGAVNKSTMAPKLFFKNVSVKWSDNSTTNSLTDLNLDIDQNQLIAVIGPVGSGKSTLFSTILKELPIISGTMVIQGKVSYASQETWLFLGSIRQNILFGEAYDEARYQTVIKVCALESDLKMLPQGEHMIVGEKGKALSGGQRARVNLARCVYRQADIYLLDDPLSAVDTKVGKQLYEECIKRFLSNKVCILITHQLQYLQSVDKIIILNNGKISGIGSYMEMQSSSLNFATMLKELHNESKNEESLIKSEDYLENIEEEEYKANDNLKENISTDKVKAATYWSYFRMGGNIGVIIIVFVVLLIAHAFAIGGDYFLACWLNSEQKSNENQANNGILSSNAIFIYAGLILGTIIMAFSHTTFFFIFLVRASSKLHDTIFENILCATMKFFNNNPSGRILNRFSKDMGIIDEYIPYLLIELVDIFFPLVATIIVSCIINPLFFVPCAILVLILYLLRAVYIETSRQVRRIEATTRSPMYNHVVASVNGLTTIRAFNKQNVVISEYDTIQDHHSSAWYLYISSGEAFGLWIDIVCLVFIATIIFSFLLLKNGYYSGDVGFMVTSFLALTGMLQWGIFQWSELESSMTCVERVAEYTNLEMEPERSLLPNVPSRWPEFGTIIFNNLSMKYDENGTFVLKDLNFTISAGAKIGVVGRTGAGKTSTIAALFQFYPLKGSIIIDGIDTTRLPLKSLRSKISLIPQDCILFSGTLRKNLDPFEEYNDDVIWNALEQVEMKNYVTEILGELNTPISDGGFNFSVGQRQLICLTRAIIRNNKIIVMDEATANIDSYTDALIQRTIRKNFANCTIITIAHRLHTIMDSDKVLVMDKGEVVEFDSPYNLLQYDNSIFQSMVKTTGKATAKQLQTIAENKSKNTPKSTPENNVIIYNHSL